jgi:hypothetical protein
MMDEEFIRKRKERIKTIIDGLKHHEPFMFLVEDMQRSIEFSDSNWHLVDVNDKSRLLELKYNKLAAQKIVNCVEEYEQELESYDRKEEVESYYDPDGEPLDGEED